MALFKCPECGNEISDAASTCPHCGFPVREYVVKEKAEEKRAYDKKKRQKRKTKRRVVFVIVLLLLVMAAVALYVVPNVVYGPQYKAMKAAFDNLVLSYNELENEFNAENNKFIEVIDSLDALVNNGETALDSSIKDVAAERVEQARAAVYKITAPDCIDAHDYKEFSFLNVFDMINEIKSLQVDCSVLNMKIANTEIPDYSDSIAVLNKAYDNLEFTYKQCRQVTDPSEDFVIERLRRVPGVLEIEAATEENDPNTQLHKDGGYTSAVFFSHESVNDPYTLAQGPSPVSEGTDGGGQVEVYATAANANKRNEYLEALDGTIINSGKHRVLGTTVVRISDKLNATSQQNLMDQVVRALIEIDD